MAYESVGFVGGGQMAAALIGGALRAKVLRANQIIVVETSKSRRQALQSQFPDVEVVDSFDAISSCAVVVIALKPHVLRDVGTDLGDLLSGPKLWVSIAAGVSIEELSSLLKSQRVVRVMPNTPAQIGAGAAAISAGSAVTDADLDWVLGLMNSVGICFRVQEEQMHAVTGIAGSSPAYVYLIIEAMADGGVLGGLPRDMALRLAAQSVMGAAKLVLESGLHPGQLKDQVTSPGGTTIAALRKLEDAAVRSAMIEAVHAATTRSRELGKG